MKKIKKVRKVVIPAAGWGTRFLPITKVVPKELLPVLNKPITHYLAKEAAAAGIEEVILVISPRKHEISKYFMINSELEKELKSKNKIELLQKVKETNTLVKISIAIQNEQLGLGHAIMVAADITNEEPFAVILGDDLIDAKIPAIKQLVEEYNKTGKSIIGVQTINNKDLHKYGVVKPKNELDKNNNVFEIVGAIEKPKPIEAPSNKAILGRYVFTPRVMELLRHLKPGKGNEINVVDCFEQLAKEEGILAFDFEGKRYDLGSVEGFIKANIDFALKDKEIREDILEHIKNIIEENKTT